MKCVFSSDWHGSLLDISMEADLLCLIGDICPFFSSDPFIEAENQLRWIEQVLNPHLDASPIKHKLICAGNHDLIMGMYRKQVAHHIHAEYIEHEAITINKEIIFMSPYTYLPNWADSKMWAFGIRNDELLEKAWYKIPRQTTILCCHSPIHGYMDVCPRIGSDSGYENIGSTSLLRRIDKLNSLRVFACGHSHHQDPFQMERNKIKLLNCAQSIISFEF